MSVLRPQFSKQFLSLLFLLLVLSTAWAETGVLTLQVTNVFGKPIKGRLEIGLIRGGGTAWTLDDGKALIPLEKEIKEHSFVTVKIVTSPPGTDYAILSPYDYRLEVPPFSEKEENFQAVTVVSRGDREALASGNFRAAIAVRINKESAQKSASPGALPVDPKASLEAVAKAYGYSAEELDHAIRSWTPDPNNLEQLGQKALYEKNYPEATEDFQKALQQSLNLRRKADANIVRNSYFLGVSLFEQGKYTQAAAAYQQCLAVDPMQTTCLNNEAAALHEARKAKQALPLYRSALSIRMLEYGPSDLGVADYQSNLATLLLELGNTEEAEKLHEKAYNTRLAKLGPNDPRVAQSLNGMGEIFERKGKFPEAEAKYRDAIDIDKKALGEESAQVATFRNNLGLVLRKQRKNAEGEKECQEALRIGELVLPPNHPDTARVLDNLGGFASLRGDRAEAERFYRKALDIKMKILAPDDPAIATGMNNLGVLLSGDKARTDEAMDWLQKALTIRLDAFGAKNADVALNKYNIAILLETRGEYGKAKPLLEEAYATDQQILGLNDPATVMIGRSLNALKQKLASIETHP
jgi:tetratricopeptide (TPR) repeat protein